MSTSRKRKITIYDIAKEAGCSAMTVSRALRTGDAAALVDKERGEKIREIAQRMGYRINHQARALILQKTLNIAFCINHHQFYYYSPTSYFLMTTLQDRLADLGYSLGFYHFKPGGDPRFARFLDGPAMCDAIAFLGRNTSPEEVEWIKASGIRALSIYQEVNGVGSVSTNEWRGGELAAETFYRNGHRKVGVLWRTIGKEEWDHRVKGFIARARELGMEIPAGANVELPPDNRERGLVARDGFSDFLRRKTKVTGLFCSSDQYSIPIVQYMDEAGIRLGEDFSLISYDNFEAYGDQPWEGARITAIDPLRKQMGIAAADFLAGTLALGAAPHIKLDPVVVERGSVAKLS